MFFQEVIYEDSEMLASIPVRSTQKNSIQHSTQPNISPILENGFNNCKDENSLNSQEKILTRRATTKTISMNMATGDEDGQGLFYFIKLFHSRNESWEIRTAHVKASGLPKAKTFWSNRKPLSAWEEVPIPRDSLPIWYGAASLVSHALKLVWLELVYKYMANFQDTVVLPFPYFSLWTLLMRLDVSANNSRRKLSLM